MMTITPEKHPMQTFMNNLRILRSIDLHELEDAGIFPKNLVPGVERWEKWEAFRIDPARAIMSWDDKKIDALWEIIRRRQ
jgi:hypothetical protein